MSTKFRHIIQTVIVAAITCALSATFIDSFSSMTDLQLSIESKDYMMSDVYNAVANKRPVQTLSDEIVIVGVDGCSRQEIAQIINSVNQSNPSVVGIDMLFPWQYEEDSILVTSIIHSDNLILACELSDYDDNQVYHGRTDSYFVDTLTGIPTAAANLETYSIGESVRQFRREYKLDGQIVDGFASAVSKMFSPSAYSNLVARGNETESIKYISREIATIPAQDIISGGINDILCGKIVLIGDLDDVKDYHATPISNGMAGVMIHAHEIDTIISGSYIKDVSSAVEWILALALSILFIALNFYVIDKAPYSGNLILRIIQVLIMYLMFLIGCRMFASHETYFDFSPAIAMIGLSMFSFDIWMGLVGVVKHIKNKNHIVEPEQDKQ